MFELDKPVKILQLIGAALAIPAGLAGTVAVLRNFGAGGVSCHDLRNSISTTLERNIAADAKRALVRGDVEQFNKYCAADDPDSRIVFNAAIAPEKPPRSNSPKPAGTQDNTPAMIFGLSRSGERRGWVALIRHDVEHHEQINFDGFAISATAMPPPGTILKSRHMVPVWLEPQTGKNEPSELQGRLAAGTCVKVLAIKAGRGRSWAEVSPETCS